ncbi:rho GTPase-activating protein 7 [Elysia marginata]|uniref:Rho GTPase-activating protein 7 n=1 Tax=Elysia marginata TaxID=1093978 RepID=A0AAV4IN26_9GAST|nr:rho GTPase-activating protein 7 [Elysia marginata]
MVDWACRVPGWARIYFQVLLTWFWRVLARLGKSTRLETLNKYAGMKLEGHPRKKTASEEEDEEDFCALSERWEYQKSVRRWSRKDLQSPCSPSAGKGEGQGGGFTYPTSETEKQKTQVSQRAPSHDSLLADQEDSAQLEGLDQPDSGVSVHRQSRKGDSHKGQVQNEGEEETPSERHTSSSSSASSTLSPRLRRAASERIKTAKSLWRKMEGGLKSRKSRRHHAGSGSNRGGFGGALEISDPVLADKAGDMQARLERLHCVDIKQGPAGQIGGSTPAEPLSSRLGHASPEDTTSSKSSETESKSAVHTSSSITPLTHSDSNSPGATLPESAHRSRPVESTSSSTSNQPHSHSSPDTQKLPNSGASLSEYYTAQSQLQQNLRQAQQKTAGGLGNLMEIFLLPQDHQPGRFPTALQNGYIEKEPVLSQASAGSDCENSNAREISLSPNAQGKAQNSSTRPTRDANRTSVYDNFGLPNAKPSDTRILNSHCPRIDESRKESSSTTRSARAMSADNAGQSSSETFPTPKDRSVSFDASSERNLNPSESSASIRNRSVSFESSSVLGGKENDGSVFGASVSSTQSSNRTEAYVDSLPTKGIAHSASADSYFREPVPPASTSDTGSVSSATSQDDGSSICSSSTLQYSNYEEFEAILKQLYENISDLTSVIDWDDDDTTSQPSNTKATTSSSATTELHIDTPSLLTSSGRRSRPQPGPDPNIDLDLEDLDSPSSPTSDPLALSPTASRGEGATDESLDLDQQENSSSSSAGDGGSHTADSGSDDAEPLIADLSHDDSLDTIPAVTRERRDSGVGHSLTRAPSDRRRKKIRWHSFQRSHRPDVNCRAHQVNALTVGQLVRLQKLALLKLTGIMEKCLPVNKSGWNWMMPRFMKRHKAPDFSDRTVFGVPLSVMVQRTGQPLPQCVLYAMRYLRRTSQTSIGIFRKSGVKSKIQQLRDHLEAHPDTTDFEGMNTYNVADMLKTFFRDLPECLLTSKMSETFRSIYSHVPPSQRLEAMQAAILLLPDENREVLQSILLFLSDISSHQADHQMNASNLAVCFTPTVFQLGRSGSGSPASPKRGRKLGSGNSPGTPDPREIMEQKAAHECLHMLISECKNLFSVPAHLFRQLQVISLAHEEPGPLHDLGTSSEEIRAFGQERIQLVLKEAHDRKSHWHFMHSVGDVEVYNRKAVDDYPLKEWKLIVDIEAPPIEVLRRIMHERHAWDEDLLSWSVVERLDPHSDIFQYALNTMAPHPSRHYCVLRYWRSDLTKGSCALVTMSVEHADIGTIQGVWAVDLGSYFLMEPCGAGRSRLTYITRVDTRGRTPEWYTKMYGYIQANFLERLKDSFKQDTTGPETKV